jgi:hypothetical protein
MSVNLPDHYTIQYATNIELKLQEMGSKFRPLVDVQGGYTGKQASPIDQVGAIEAQTPAGRFVPKTRTDAALDRRWIFPIDKEVDQLVDQFDKLRLITDPQSKYVENATMAIGRAMDDEVIDKALATSSIGEQGSGSETFDTTNFSIAAAFGAASATGLTVKKLIEANRMFRGAFVDLDRETKTVVIGSQQEADLLNQAQVQSTDFNPGAVLVEGRVVRFMGFNIVVSERLDKVSNDRYVIAFVKSGIHLGVWKEQVTNISHRTDLTSEPWDIYNCMTFGATRTQQGKVVRILCDES